MNSKRFWATLLALSVLGPHSSTVWAQLSDMAACPTGWEWNKNSLGQDPCTISSMLDAACRGIGSYTIPPLNSTQNYVPPQRDSTADLTCDCDTVMYSLYMACSTCQGGIIYSWATWIAQCDSVYVTQYPHDIPYGTAVPHWAFYNITSLPNQTYSDSVAISVGRNPEASGKVLSTATLGGSSSGTFPLTYTTSSYARSPTNTSDSSSGNKVNIAVIAGGVAGGVVLLVGSIVAICIVISRRKRRMRNQFQPPPQVFVPQETAEYQKVQPMSPMLSPTAANLPYNPTTANLPYNPSASPNHLLNAPASPNPPLSASYYNPEDPTTFPPPMGDGQSSLTYTNPGQNGPGQYGGIPEL